jgi:glycosyltransferase XagB
MMQLIKKRHVHTKLKKTGAIVVFSFLAVIIASILSTPEHKIDQWGSQPLSVETPSTREHALSMLANLDVEETSAAQSSQTGGRLRQFSRQITSIFDGLHSFFVKPRKTESEIFLVICLLLLIPQGLFTLSWMLYAWNDPQKVDTSNSPCAYYEPTYSFTAIVAARQEEKVIKDTIYAIDAINYPSHLKEILVSIRDEDDEGTITKVKEAIEELGNSKIQLITFKDGPQNKPHGLNRGLLVAKNDVVCVFDAEDEPHPEIYHIVNTVMLRDEVDVVQSGVQLMNIDSTWFSALNCLEYFLWFKSGLRFFTNLLHVTPLGGNTVFFKRASLNRIGGWDDRLLTEDADIGIRMTIEGAKLTIVYDAQHVTQEETPATTAQFIKQRTRWSQGFYEILLKFEWLRLTHWRQKVGALCILANPLIQASMMIYLPLGLYILLTQQVSVVLAILSYIPLAFLLIQLLVSLAGIIEFSTTYSMRLPRFFILKVMTSYYPFQLMLAFSAFRAIYRYLKGYHAWEKTTHSNLHRTTINHRRESF